MESVIIYASVFVLFLGLESVLCFVIYSHRKERSELLNRLMARNYPEYISYSSAAPKPKIQKDINFEKVEL